MRRLPTRSRFYDICLPEIKLSMVVFPQPEGPRMAVKVPGLNLPVHDFKISLMPSSSTILP